MKRDFSVNLIGALVLSLAGLGEFIHAADAPASAPPAANATKQPDWRARMDAQRAVAEKDRQQMLDI